MASTNTPLNVALLGFDERSRETMRLIFHGPGKRCCVLVDEEHAEAGIINLDSVDGRTLLEGFRQRYPGRPIIIMAVKDPGVNDVVFLNKPISQIELLSAVQTLAKERRASSEVVMEQAVGAEAAVPVSPAPKKVASVADTLKDEDFYDPLQFLQGELQSILESIKHKEIVVKLEVMSSGAAHKIFLIPSLNRVVHQLSKAQLAQLCGTPAFLLELTAKRYSPKDSLSLELSVRQKKLGEPVDTFLWRVARYTSYGRLPLGTDISLPTYLSCWPNFTRLPSSNNAMRIAALLVEQPRPLPLVAKVLGIPLRDVFLFYSAAHAIGLAGISQRSVDHLLQTETPSPPRQHGLFGRLLKRLKDIGNAAA